MVPMLTEVLQYVKTTFPVLTFTSSRGDVELNYALQQYKANKHDLHQSIINLFEQPGVDEEIRSFFDKCDDGSESDNVLR